MTQITIEISDKLMSCLEQQSSPIQDIVIKALENYIETKPQELTKTRTWQLCGSLEVSEPDPKYIIGKDNQSQVITNYAENVDQYLYYIQNHELTTLHSRLHSPGDSSARTTHRTRTPARTSYCSLLPRVAILRQSQRISSDGQIRIWTATRPTGRSAALWFRGTRRRSRLCPPSVTHPQF